jgi:hypothetical protein
MVQSSKVAPDTGRDCGDSVGRKSSGYVALIPGDMRERHPEETEHHEERHKSDTAIDWHSAIGGNQGGENDREHNARANQACCLQAVTWLAEFAMTKTMQDDRCHNEKFQEKIRPRKGDVQMGVAVFCEVREKRIQRACAEEIETDQNGKRTQFGHQLPPKEEEKKNRLKHQAENPKA